MNIQNCPNRCRTFCRQPAARADAVDWRASETSRASARRGSAVRHGSGERGEARTYGSGGKIDPAKEAAIRHLMDLTQTSKMGESLTSYVTNQVRQALSQAIPPDRLAKLMDGFSQKMVTAAPATGVTDAVIPIYARAFSMEDIQAITQFYESPLGQRVVNALPQVTRESEELGMQMQQKGAMNVLQEMSSDYPELKQMLQTGAGKRAGSGASSGESSRARAEASSRSAIEVRRAPPQILGRKQSFQIQSCADGPDCTGRTRSPRAPR